MTKRNSILKEQAVVDVMIEIIGEQIAFLDEILTKRKSGTDIEHSSRLYEANLKRTALYDLTELIKQEAEKAINTNP